MASEEGRCNTVECYTSDIGAFISCNSSQCTFGNCFNASGQVNIPNTVPIKGNISGLNPSPFVKLRFEGPTKPNGDPAPSSFWDYTEITTGNISQPYNSEQCRAAIKSFQYSWGAIESGNTCKVLIVDELGSSLEKWFQRIFKNMHVDPINDPQGVYKMRITWGWIIAGENGECPADMSYTGPAYCVDPISSIPVTNNSTAPSRFICSLPCYFLPDVLNINYQGNKIFYEITGKDLLQRAGEQPTARVYGNDTQKMFFTEAVKHLGEDSIPSFKSVFKRLDENGEIKDMQFYVPSGTAFGSTGEPANRDEIVDKGPYDIWSCHEMSPIQAIRQWITSHGVKAASTELNTTGVGIVLNYDPVNRELIFWTDGHPSCQSIIDINTRLKAAYINGGRCSPVLSFTPTVRYNFLAAAAAGGLTTTITGDQSKMSDQRENNKCYLPGRGSRTTPVPAGPAMDRVGAGVGNEIEDAAAKQRRATFLHNSIEAELRVQGDPSDFLCSPLYGAYRTIALIVLSPFYIDDQGWECPVWQNLSSNSCSAIFTSNSWFIKGVDHQIKDGSYSTTYRLVLFPPNSEITPGVTNDNVTLSATIGLGGQLNPVFDLETTSVCNQGTYPCAELDTYPKGYFTGEINKKSGPGQYAFCIADCLTTPGVT